MSGTADFTLSLSVTGHYRDCRLVVRQDGREVVSKRMKKAIPAEMVQLAVKAGNLRRIGALEVSVE